MTTLLQDDAGTIWVGGNDGLYQVDAQGNMTVYPLDSKVNDLIQVQPGLIWAATGKGLSAFDTHSHQWTRHEGHDEGRADSLSDDQTRNFYRDRQGLLWIGTSKGGVNLYDPRQDVFGRFGYDPHAVQSLAAGGVSDVFATPSGSVWAGVGSSLDHLDFQKGQINHYGLVDAGFPDSPISSVYQDHADTVWLATRDFHLYRFDVTAKQYTAVEFKSQGNRSGQTPAIIDMYEDAQGYMWVVVNQDGLYRLDPAKGETQFFRNPPNAPPPGVKPPPPPKGNGPQANTPPNPPISSIYPDREGNIWVSTLNGIRRFDPKTGEYQQFRIKKDEVGPDSFMEAAVEDANGLMWIASHDGLIQFDPKTQAAQYYTKKDGLVDDFLSSIVQDKMGYLWLGTQKGLPQLDFARL